MKDNILTAQVAICFCLLSCSSPSGSGSPGTRPDSINAKAVNSPPSVRQEPVPPFKTLHTALPFAGIWVNEAYFDNIRRNRSPRLDQNIAESCITIPDSTLKRTVMVGGFHDGGEYMVVVRDGDKYQFYDGELKLPLDTIEPISPERLRIGDQYFRALKHPNVNKNDLGILEEILFSGKYQKEDGDEVVFGTDGHIQGLETVSYYEPEIDYADRPDRQLDLINLGQSHEKLDEYAFRFDKDTLLIYVVNCLHYDASARECDSSTFGPLMWKLRRMSE